MKNKSKTPENKPRITVNWDTLWYDHLAPVLVGLLFLSAMALVCLVAYLYTSEFSAVFLLILVLFIARSWGRMFLKL